MTLLARLADILERDGRAVLVTVTDAVGSAPRDAGARMAVAENGSFTGTISYSVFVICATGTSSS